MNVVRFRGRARIIRETAPADGNLPARPLVPPHSVWDDNRGINVVAPSITIGQVIDYFRRKYPTIRKVTINTVRLTPLTVTPPYNHRFLRNGILQ